jgi:hypothetical protein
LPREAFEICSDKILEPEVPHALRLQGILVGGVVKIYSKQQTYLLGENQFSVANTLIDIGKKKKKKKKLSCACGFFPPMVGRYLSYCTIPISKQLTYLLGEIPISHALPIPS